MLEESPRSSRSKPINNQKSDVAVNEFPNGLGPVSSSKIGIASYNIRFLYVLSANSEKSLKSQMQSLGIYLEQRPEALELSLMGKLAYTLGQRRSFLTWKVASCICENLIRTSSQTFKLIFVPCHVSIRRGYHSCLLGKVLNGMQWVEN